MNGAYPVTPNTRILCNADYIVHDGPFGDVPAPWPIFDELLSNTTFYTPGQDHSWNRAWYEQSSVFLRIFSPKIPYMVNVDEKGRGFIHGHELNGSKYWTWGNTPSSDWRQEYLSMNEPGQGLYYELMSGHVATLEQRWNLPANSSLEWTDWFKPMQNVSNLLDPNHDNAIKAVENWLKSPNGVSVSKIAEMKKFFATWSNVPVVESSILYKGSPWGALQEKMTGKKLAPSTLFTYDPNDQKIQPWLELVSSGTFSQQSLDRLFPLSYLVAQDWQQLIQDSARNHGPTWLHYLHQGIAQTEAGYFNQAIELLQMSINLKPNPVAYRTLALLVDSNAKSYEYFMLAWNLIRTSSDPQADDFSVNLASEFCVFLVDTQDYSHLDEFLDLVPARDPFLTRDYLLLCHAVDTLNHHDYDGVQRIIRNNEFPSLSDRWHQLSDVWFQSVYMKEQSRLNRPLTPVERHQLRLKNPTPRSIGPF